MEWIEGMNSAVNYIEEHLCEELDYDRMGQLAGCSPHHFQRIFTYLGGVTLSEYIRRRRMSLAAVDLKDVSRKVIDISLKYGYDSPTAFNRAFQSVHGISPSDARAEGSIVKSFPPIRFRMIVKGAEAMNYRIEKKDAFRVVGVSTGLKQSVEENFTIGPAFWAEAIGNGTVARLAQMMDTPIQGLLGISTCNNTDEWQYYIAVSSTLEKEEFEELVIPKCTWAVFYEEGPISRIQELESRIIAEWLPTSGYEYANAPDVELYLNSDPMNAKYEVWVPIVRKGEK